MEHMGLVVYPAMKEAFQGYDGERFAEFKCQTCHGDDAKEVNYEMPNAVTPLPADDPIAGGNDMDPEMTKFMMESVLPAMNENMAGEEIKCLSCHIKG
jgi:mono/diheme cytochrome c family protein